MVRPALSDFVHTVDLYPTAGAGSDGPVFGVARLARPALVDEKVRLVTDQRTGATQGQQIAASALVGVFLEDYVKPGSDIVIRKGTPAERRAQVVAAAYYDHPAAPEHAELWVE